MALAISLVVASPASQRFHRRRTAVSRRCRCCAPLSATGQLRHRTRSPRVRNRRALFRHTRRPALRHPRRHGRERQRAAHSDRGSYSAEGKATAPSTAGALARRRHQRPAKNRYLCSRPWQNLQHACQARLEFLQWPMRTSTARPPTAPLGPPGRTLTGKQGERKNSPQICLPRVPLSSSLVRSTGTGGSISLRGRFREQFQGWGGAGIPAAVSHASTSSRKSSLWSLTVSRIPP